MKSKVKINWNGSRLYVGGKGCVATEAFHVVLRILAELGIYSVMKRRNVQRDIMKRLRQ